MSFILNDHKLIFIHIPKSGGITITRAFTAQGPNHKKMEWYDLEYDIENYYKFTMVRNPWDRLVSAYFYYKNSARISGAISRGSKMPIQGRELVNCRNTFAEFVEYFYENMDEVKINEMFNDQHRYMPDILRLKFDYICRHEKFEDSIFHVCEEIGIPMPKIGHWNHSTHDHYTTYYDDDSIGMVGEIYGKDIELLGYAFREKYEI